MGILDFLRGPDINEGVTEFHSSENAVLLDVRTQQEYGEGHIPGSINIPLQEIGQAARIIPNKNTPVFVHCLSGARSQQASSYLEQLGYTKVKNIGGISSYRGKTEQ